MSPAAWPRALVVTSLLVTLVFMVSCGGGSGRSDGSITVGLVTNNPNGLRNVQGFIEGMARQGYLEGDNVTYLFAGEPKQGADLDRELESFVAAGVDLIFTAGTPTGVAALRITADTNTPVVFGVIADPLAAGVMEDLAHPGGNMTGVKLGQHQDRRLELLLELLPETRTVLVPYNPDDSAATSAVEQISRVAGSLGVELVRAEAHSDEEVTNLLGEVPTDIDAIFLVPDSTVNSRLADIVALAEARKLPISGPSTAQVEEGALMTYGFVHAEAGIQAARIARQVLLGADPGDIPVEDAESYLAVNLEVADELGLEVADKALQQADFLVRAAGIGIKGQR